MKLSRWIPATVFGALLFAALTPRLVLADEWNDRTVVNFSNPVQVPGATLDAGTYVFKVLQSDADRVVVQILNPREDHVYATLVTQPNYHGTAHARLEDPTVPTPEKTHFIFYEARQGQPPAIKTWFYPGQSYGFDFLYSNDQ